jgi:beta-glucanase (GH16 family)
MSRLGRARPHPPLIQRKRATSTSTQSTAAQAADLALTGVAGTSRGAQTTTAQPATLGLTGVAAQSATVLFFDDFSGTSIDSTKWDVYNRLGDQDNSELNGNTPANVTVGSSLCNITAKFEDIVSGDTTTGAPNPRTVHYSSGHIAQKGTFKYGTVEVRAKMPGGTGAWPALWMLDYSVRPHQINSADEPSGSGFYGEIDFAEFMNNARSSVNCQIHWFPIGTGQVDPGGIVSLPYDATTRFMVYRLQWTNGSAIFSVDPEDGGGFQTIQTITGSANIPNMPMYVTINMAVGGNGGGAPDSSTFPLTMQLDYVRVTANSDTTLVSQSTTAQPATLTLTGVAGTSTSVLSTAAQPASLALTAPQGTSTAGAVTKTAQPATLALAGVAGTATLGPASVIAQTAPLALTGVAGTATLGPASVIAQPAALALTGVPGSSAIGSFAQTTTAQPGALALTGVAGVSTGGPAATTAQVAVLSLTGVQGSSSIGSFAQTTTAQVAALSLTAIQGSSSIGSFAQTTTAQPATLVLAAVQGAMSTGPVVMVAQVATLALTAIPGSSAMGSFPQTSTAQPATLALAAVAGAMGAGPVTVTAQPAALALTGVSGASSIAGVTLAAQVATLALSARSGTSTAGPAGTTAQPATLALIAVPSILILTVIIGRLYTRAADKPRTTGGNE